MNFGATQHLAALNLASGASQVTAGGAKVLVTRGLSIDPAAAQLDLTDNSMIVHYTGGTPHMPSPELENVKQWLAAGYNALTWTGNGIVSSAAAADPIKYGLGYAQNDMLFLPYDVFSGEPVDLSTVLVKFTYNGDVNLDGCVDDNDVTFINLFYDGGITTSHYWNEGDICGYDGRIDDNDVTILGLTYGAGWLWGEPLGIGGPLGTVPEPATLALAALGGLGILLRRRQRKAAPPRCRQRFHQTGIA
ncbi:MAG: PEP-CTERM sorting domain-containing protein [Planctomycetota bacterium]|nr:PEP-CTERM sorting domain-containing protein [Planctomycetota bacterium]